MSEARHAHLLDPPDSIELQPFHHRVRDQLVQPKRVVIATRYFWEKWAPRLGPTLTVLIVRLRMHCYYNQQTNERRDWCFPTQQTLAEEIGVSRWTVMRELRKPLAREFVRVQYRSRYDPARKQTIRVSSLYHVAMDDPLISEDRDQAARLLAQPASDIACPVSPEPPFCDFTDGEPEVVEASVTQGNRHHISMSRPVQIASAPSWSNLTPKEEPLIQTPVADVVRDLVNQHITVGVAEQLAVQFPVDRIREKLALVRRLAAAKGGLRNTAGFLRKAIEDDYQLALEPTGTDAAVALLEPRGAQRTAARLALAMDRSEAVESLSPERHDSGPPRPDVWEQAKEQLRAELSPAAFEHWVLPGKLHSYGPGLVRLQVPDRQIQRYLQYRLGASLEGALGAVCGETVAVEILSESY